MKKGLLTMIIISLLVIASVILIPFTETNYDLTTYLPTDSETLNGLHILIDEFGEETSIQVQINDISVDNVIVLKQSITAIDGVNQVIWLDDYVDLSLIPISMIPAEQVSPFYEDNHALLTIIMGYDSYDLLVEDIVEDIHQVLTEYTYAMRGEAINNIENRTIANQEVFKIILIIVPILIVILFLASSSWFEPVLILITLAIAVLINYGTNFFIPNVSFITNTMALALQLALSIDYALFLTHRYREEREKIDDPRLAMKAAFKKTFPAITASALTTIAGFLSLMFMRYRIGLDIGVVLSKGIILSYLATLIVLPIILVWGDHLIEKTKHKTLIKSPKWYITVMNKIKYPLLVLLCGVVVIGVIFQQKTEYLYGNNASFDDSSIIQQDLKTMDEQFGVWNPLIILIPKHQVTDQVSLIQDLMSTEHITGVQSLYTTVDPSTPLSFIPQPILDQFVGDTYERMLISLDIQIENDTLYTLSDTINDQTSNYFDDYHIIGAPSSTTEIRDVVTNDTFLITSLSIVAIFIILAITFKSIIIPILLVGIIQAAIWMNVSILFFSNITTLYIGYLVVMAIQLGATIDYAVLLTNRYLQNRVSMNPKEALHKAFERAAITIFISALVLSLAGFIEGWFSNISAIQEIGFLLGKGALISVFFVYIFLPPALLVLDKLLIITQFHKRKEKDITKEP